MTFFRCDYVNGIVEKPLERFTHSRASFSSEKNGKRKKITEREKKKKKNFQNKIFYTWRKRSRARSRFLKGSQQRAAMKDYKNPLKHFSDLLFLCPNTENEI